MKEKNSEFHVLSSDCEWDGKFFQKPESEANRNYLTSISVDMHAFVF